MLAIISCGSNKEDFEINDVSKYKVEKDIVWASPEGFDLTLDIYSPLISLEPRPVLVIFHGGGWLVNDKSIMDQMSQYLATNSNYVICNVNYRLLSDLDNSVTLDEIIGNMTDSSTAYPMFLQSKDSIVLTAQEKLQVQEHWFSLQRKKIKLWKDFLSNYLHLMNLTM